MQVDILSSLPDGIKWQKSDSGWMTSEVFHYYIEHVFYADLVEKSVEFPIILYVDGHKTHLTYPLSILCDKLKIILICLYPNSTRILQPADVAVFKPIKCGWQKAILNWRRKNLDKKITRVDFAPILKTVVDTCLKADMIINGFRTCGLCPFNPSAIDFSKCLGKMAKPNEIPQGPNTLENVAIDQEKTINYKRFSEVVGEEKILQFKNFDTSACTYTDDFLKLYEIYKDLHNNDQEQDHHVVLILFYAFKVISNIPNFYRQDVLIIVILQITKLFLTVMKSKTLLISRYTFFITHNLFQVIQVTYHCFLRSWMNLT